MALDKLISHARGTDQPGHPPLPVDSMIGWIEARAADTRAFLVFVDEDGSRLELSYSEFVRLTLRCAAGLLESGLRPGDRIATLATNHWHTVVYYFAAWYSGLTVVPVNLSEDDDRIRFILSHGEVKWAYVAADAQPRLARIAPDLPHSTKLLASSATVHIPSVPIESDALIVYTSGTTGRPKGVLLTQANLLEDARAIAEWQYIDATTRMMCVLPIHHVNGTVVTLLTPFYAGASVVLLRRFQANRFFDTVDREQVHVVSVVPTLLQFLNQLAEPTARTPLKRVICGAGPLTVTVARNFESTFGIRIIHGYGLSETTCYSCFLPLDLTDEEHASWMGDSGYPSIGVALPVNEMAIHDAFGQPLPDGDRGEIVIRGYNVMKEYYGNPEANEKAFTFGWFRSGDEGFATVDAKGRRFFFITGRIKELIIRGGVNLAPLEIDEVLAKAPGVKSGISVGFENDWYGEEVGAYVVMHEGAEHDSEAILQHCREHLPFSKCPKVVVFGTHIPVTSTGKYQRMHVEHLFKQWKDVQFRAHP